MKKTALIVGVSGQDGAYLSALLVGKGYRVIGTSRDALLSPFANLKKLSVLDTIETTSLVPTDFRSVIQTLAEYAPDEIYYLAGQSSVSLSFQMPVETLESISHGILNILEAVRFLKLDARIYNAGSSEVFGDCGTSPADETTPFNPVSPYAVAKAASIWQVRSYRKAYGLFACSGLLFNHESPLRPAHFVTRKIILGALQAKADNQTKILLGNLDVVRDWGWAPEFVQAMWKMLQTETAKDYVIATGHSMSLREFCSFAYELVGLDYLDHIEINHALLRPNDPERITGNPGKAMAELEWQPSIYGDKLIRKLLDQVVV